MLRLLLQIAINAIAIWAAAEIVPGVVFASNYWLAFLWVGAVFGLVNFLLRPILTFFSIPFIVVTLGLFMLVINAALLGVTAALLDVLSVSGFWAAVFGGLVISIVAWMLEIVFGISEGTREPEAAE